MDKIIRSARLPGQPRPVVSFRLAVELRERLASAARYRGETASATLERALIAYLYSDNERESLK